MTTLFSLFRRAFTLASAFLLASVVGVSAQTVINAVPYTISASGKYVLGSNLNNASTSTPAITVNAPNVQLDLNGFYVAGASNTASNNAVIRVNNFANVAIRNGLVSGDGYGILFATDTNSRNYVVERMTISRCFQAGVYFYRTSPGSLVRNNSFSNIGGSTTSANYSPSAIYNFAGVRIENNLIANVTPSGNGTSYGINSVAGAFAIGNTISNCTVGIAAGKNLNNLTLGCTTPFSGGTNATGNN